MAPTATFRPILYADWSVRLGENRPDWKSQMFDGYVRPVISIATDYLARVACRDDSNLGDLWGRAVEPSRSVCRLNLL